MTTLQGSWIWYELMTSDVAGAKAFYEAVVDWSMAPGSPETGDYGFISAADGAMVGGILSLSDNMIEHGAQPCWLGYIGVDDVDARAATIESAGGSLLMPARDVPMAGRIAMLADAGGAPFYIMAPAPPPGGAESTAFQPDINCGHCGWNELLAADAPREVAFYSGQFGWSLPEAMDMGPMGKYQFIAHDGVTVGAIMPVMPQTPHPLWNHYFWVASITAAKIAIEAAGGQVINGPMQVPGDGWIVQGIDPQGAMFSLVGGE
ncbi:MAG: VOC family protein [Novosphingobium sp.]|uniref:VOC family protein n=1 Tax=Novosphingobium sp. TaxID=1874826 RepID=UPI0032BD0CFD